MPAMAIAPASPPLFPEQALARGRWVKWIGGASNQDLAAIEDLAGLYSLAGVHCLDLAADPAVLAAARRGISWAESRGAARPWLMVSLSDGADPHFRKAWFDPARCPPTCPRPCARVCPALAIPPLQPGGLLTLELASGPTPGPRPGSGAEASRALPAGVLANRCYGCGRCLPACPLGLIQERDHNLPAAQVADLLAELQPDAVELHTRIGRADAFAERLEQVRASGVPLRRLAVSCGLESAAGAAGLSPAAPTPEALAQELWQRHGQVRQAGLAPLWQLDGRPMSGDVGAGTARAAVRLLRAVAPLAPPGPLQLAGGTNERTLPLVQGLDPALARAVAGVAFGSVARARLQPLLLQAQERGGRLLDQADLLPLAVAISAELVRPWLIRG